MHRAGAVYALFGEPDAIEWQLRTGPHEVRADDWERAMDFFDTH